MNRAGLIFCAAMLAVSSGLSAQTIVYSENFNAENGGASASNYTGFNTLEYRFGPSEADLVSQGTGGVNCAGGTGSCLALNGLRTGIGYELWTKNAFAFNPGDLVTFSLQAAGNPASASSDIFGFGVSFNTNLVVRDVTLTNRSGTSIVGPGNFFSSGFGGGESLAGTDPFFTYAFSFTAVDGGFVRPVFGIPGLFVGTDDDVGPIIDNLSLSISSAVPEPATWAMMILGFGFAGFAMRRRQAARASFA